MKTKITLLTFLIFAGVLVWAGYTSAQTTNNCDGKEDGDSCTGELIGGGVCIGGSCDVNKDLQCYNEANGTTCNTGTCQNDKCVADDSSSSYVPGEESEPSSTTSSGAKCDSANFKEIAGVCFPKNTGLAETSISTILSNALFWLLGIFGFFGIAGFVISGIQYLVSAGNEKGIETAKRNMKWSLVGVVVGISGMVIIKAITAALEATTSSF